MNADWTVPAFTPAKFVLLALAAIAITLGADRLSTPQQRPASAEQATLLRSVEYGQSNGPRTEAVYYFIPSPPTHVPERTAPSAPPPAPVVRRPYPPL